MIRKLSLISLIAGAGLVIVAGAAQSQTYPSQPIRIVVSSSPGGPNDTVARLASQTLSSSGSRPWSRTAPAPAARWPRARSRPPSPTATRLMVGNTSTMAVIPAMSANPGYDSLKDFAPVARFWESYELLVVNASSPWKSAKELIDAAKASSRQDHLRAHRPGGMPNLSSELFQARTGIKLVPVPYRSGGELATAVLSQAVDARSATSRRCCRWCATGKLRALAVTSRTRTPLAPEIPTMMEARRARLRRDDVFRHRRAGRHAGRHRAACSTRR